MSRSWRRWHVRPRHSASRRTSTATCSHPRTPAAAPLPGPRLRSTRATSRSRASRAQLRRSAWGSTAPATRWSRPTPRAARRLGCTRTSRASRSARSRATRRPCASRRTARPGSRARPRRAQPPAVWKLTGQLAGTNGLESISCPSKSLCAIGDSASNVLDLDQPGTSPGAWVGRHLAAPDSQFLFDVSCPAVSFCVDIGGNTVATSANPNYGVADLERRGAEPGRGLQGRDGQPWTAGVRISILVRRRGRRRLLGLEQPRRRRSAWRQVHIGEPDFDQYTDVACPSAALCVATDLQSGRIVYSKKPLVQGSWKFTKLTDTHNALLGVTCVGTKFCVVVAHGGDIWTTTNPTGRSSAWRRRPPRPREPVRCRLQLEVAVRRDRSRRQGARVLEPWCQASVVEGDDDRQAARESEPARPADDASDVSRTGSCIVGDDSGNVIVGRKALIRRAVGRALRRL